jgi:hypothetical protein
VFPALTGRNAHPCVLYHVALADRLRAPASAGSRPPEDPKLCMLMSSEYYIIVKTFNNGSLGSGIDEERSEMR